MEKVTKLFFILTILIVFENLRKALILRVLIVLEKVNLDLSDSKCFVAAVKRRGKAKGDDGCGNYQVVNNVFAQFHGLFLLLCCC